MMYMISALRGIVAGVFTLGCLLGIALAQTPKQACERFDRSNVDCSCVAKRMDAYIARAATPQQSRYIVESYKAELGLPNDREAVATGIFSDQNNHAQMIFQYEGVGGIPGNIDDFENGCVIAGAPLPPIPQYTPGPVRERYMKKCIASMGKRRDCQCMLALEDKRLTEQQFQYRMASRIDADESNAWSTLDERYEFLAKRSGTSVEGYKRVEREIAAIFKRHEQEDRGLCNALLAHDQNPGRTTRERAGVPLGFENPGEISSIEDLEAEQAEALAQGEAMAASVNKEAMMAEAQAKQAAFEQQRAAQQAKGAQLASLSTPRALFDQGCLGTGNGESYCSCLSAIYEETTSGVSDSVSKQLALLMVGGGLDGDASVAMMSSANPADLAQATQLFSGNMMRVMSCN